ncbi:MAG: glycosyltransferase family 39 protein [Pirellulales bacterium]|nr:glycosyltransferase family 39 protein [Pirellulales bacterium]
MNSPRRHILWILLAAGTIFFTHLGATALWDEDEPWYASTAREMYQRGDWVVPMFNGELFPEKPPLMFWTMIAGFEIFGVNELGARFFSAVFGTLTAVMVYFVGRRMFSPRVGLWAGLITASTLIFTVSARAATVDAALTFVTTGMLWCFVELMIRGRGSEVGNPGESPPAAQCAMCNLQLPICNYWLWIALYAFLGLAILGKGPIGILPAASIGLFLMIVHHRHNVGEVPEGAKTWRGRLRRFVQFLSPGNFLRSLWTMRPLTGMVVVLIVALPWHVLVGLRTDGVWLKEFFMQFNLRPFTQPILSHAGPFWYHVPAVLIGFFPWSIFLGPTAVDVVRKVKNRAGPIATRDGLILLLSWFAVPFVFWSICSTKLPHYLLPVYPALALLTGVFLEDWITEPACVARGWLRAAWLSAVLVGLVILVAIPIATHFYTPGEEWLGVIGLILIIGGGWSWWLSEHRQPLRAVSVYAVTSAVLLTALFGFAALRIDRYQNARPLIAAIRRDNSGPAALCTYQFLRRSTIFYAEQRVFVCEKPEQLQAALDSAGRAYIITLDKYAEQIQRRQPGEFRELIRQRRFLADDQMVVLVRAGSSPAARTAASPAITKE